MNTLDEAWRWYEASRSQMHGKRNESPPPVAPKAALDRLERFINMMNAQDSQRADFAI